MRKRISKNIRNMKYVSIVLVIMLLVFLIKVYSEDSNDYVSIGILLGLIPLFILLYFVFDNAKSIEFDDEHLFIVSKSTNKKILLKDIYKLKKTMTEINDRDLWRIYYNTYGVKKSIVFWPRWNSRNFKNFKKITQKVNKNIIIKK